MKREAIDEIEKIEKKDIKKNGEASAFVEKTNYLVEKYRSALFFIFFQMFIILFLLFGYLSIKSNTIVEVDLPKIVKDSDYGKLKIGIGVANELYYTVWGRYVVDSVLNIDVKSMDEKLAVLSKMMLPSVLTKYSKKLKDFRRFIADNNAVLKYTSTESSTEIVDGIGVYKSKGVERIKLGEYDEKKQLCDVEVKMQVKNFMLFITSFQRTCQDVTHKNGKADEQ